MGWRLIAVVGLAAAGGVTGLPACAVAQEAAAQTDQAAAQQPSPMFASADELLDALETADEGLRTLQADIVYIRVKAQAAVVETRVGDLYFVSEPAPGGQGGRNRRRFALDFQQKVTGGVKDTTRSVIMFDGQRLYDKDFGGKILIVRQVVNPNDPAAAQRDPMRLGEGPLPIPIGQKKADIVKLYEAELVEDLTQGLQTPEDALEEEERMYPSFRQQVTGKQGEHAARTVQLKLTARDPDAETPEIRLWYRKAAGGEDGDDGERLLPFLARTIGRDGDISIVKLTTVRVNAELAAGGRDAMAREAPPGWTTEHRDFQ